MQPRDVGSEEAEWIKNRARIGTPPVSVGEIITRLVRLRHALVALGDAGGDMAADMVEAYGLDWPPDPVG